MDELYFRKRVCPRDSVRYEIPRKLIDATVEVLLQFEEREGMVIWAGHRSTDLVSARALIVPNVTSEEQFVGFSNRDHFDLVGVLSTLSMVQLGQVHSHPGTWVDHSPGDDEGASCKIDGLISVVVPSYGAVGMTPLNMCGIHRFRDGRFERLSDTYVKHHFQIVDGLSFKNIDLRSNRK